MPFAAIAAERPEKLKSRIVLLEPRKPPPAHSRRSGRAIPAWSGMPGQFASAPEERRVLSILIWINAMAVFAQHCRDGCEPEENSMSVTRRGLFRNAAAIVGGMGLAGLGATRAQAKVAQNLVGYQDTPKDGHDCKGCKLFEPPNACKSVDGPISPNGWCKLWIKA